MLKQYVCWDIQCRDMCEVNKSLGNGFSYKVEGKHIVPLMQLDLRLRSCLDNRLVVPEYITLVTDGNSQIAKSSL